MKVQGQVKSGRLRSSRREGRSTRHLLVEEEGAEFGRERQVLDGGPTGNHTKLSDVEVGVAGVVAGVVGSVSCLTSVGCREGRTVETRPGYDTSAAIGEAIVTIALITDSRVAAEQAGRPVWIPVVVERTAHAPSRGQDETSASGSVTTE